MFGIRKLFFYCLVFGFIDPAAAEFRSDDFRAPNLGTGTWSYVDPRGDSSVALVDGRLRMVLPSTQNHDLWTSGNFAARIVQPVPDADFELEVGFESVPARAYQMQGILVESSPNDFMRFEFHSDGSHLKVFAARLLDGTAKVHANTVIATPSDGRVSLRVSRVGDEWVQRYSLDGLTWREAARFIDPMVVSSAGVFAGNAGASPPAYTAIVDYIFNTASPIVPEDGATVGADGSAPFIHNVHWSGDTGSVVVTWNTDELADGLVEYGTTTAYEGGAVSHQQGLYTHSLTVPAPPAGGTYNFRITSVDGVGNRAASGNFQYSADSGPNLDIWYGDYQKFGWAGRAQRWVNVLGNVSDPDGVASLSYSLNGEPFRPLSIGPDGRRLAHVGDFNIELAFADLLTGQNTVVIKAVDALGDAATKTVVVDVATNMPILPYTIDWPAVANLQDVTQAVDGRWTNDAVGTRPASMAYDRLLALGDIAWDDYVVSVPITLHAINPACNPSCQGNPGVGAIVRWQGHYDWDGSQPRWGWWPLGAIGWIRWDSTGGYLQILGSDGSSVAVARNQPISVGETYRLKILAQTVPGDAHLYRLKLWPVSQPEPEAWNLTAEQGLLQPGAGSVVLVAHHIDATFGRVDVTPLTPPVISDITTDIQETSASVAWSTSEPSDSVIEYGPTASYGASLSQTELVDAHQLLIGGLEPGTTYHYRLKSVDREGEVAASSDRTFTTAPASAPTLVDDFSGGTLDTAWLAVDPKGDAAFRMTGERLAIDVSAGTSHDVWTSGIDAPRVTRSIGDTDFEAEVRFDSLPQERYQLQGLLIEQDPANFIRFDTYSDGGALYLFYSVFTGGAPAVTKRVRITAQIPLYLRVERSGDEWMLRYSYDGANWVAFTAFTHPFTASSVAVFAGNAGGTPPPFTALVDYFKLIGQAIVDTTAPSLGDIEVVAGETDAVLSWTTSEPADSVVHYGVDTAYGNLSSDTALVTSHQQILTGLQPDTTYHYELRGTDAGGNTGTSGDLSFHTNGGAYTLVDEFDGATLDPGWDTIDPKGDGVFTLGGGRLTIDVPAGIPHDVWRSGNFAPRIMRPVTDGDLEVEVKFDSPLTSPYQLRGVLVQGDSLNYLRFGTYSDGASVKLFVAAFVGGVPTVKVTAPIGGSAAPYLRVGRVADQWTVSYSYDGINWLQGGTFSHSLTVASAGAYAGNAGTSPPAHTAVIDYFRLQ